MEISLQLENLYCKSSIKLPGVSVLQKELEYEVEKLTKYVQEVSGHAAEDQNQIRTFSW